MKLLNLFPPFVALALAACASSKSEVPTMNDVAAVEATANEALRLAREDSSRIVAMSLYLDFISKRIDLLDSISAALPLMATDENRLQITLLREEVTFLRQFLENQNKVPLVNPSREQVPQLSGPLPKEYEQAQYLFTQKKYEAAAKEYERVTVLYPKSDWADAAWYWAGESHMAIGNYAQAISAFEKVFFYSSSIRHPDAQFQIGICMLRMGNREHAVAAFRKVQDFYPKSPRSLQAQSELNKLK